MLEQQASPQITGKLDHLAWSLARPYRKIGRTVFLIVFLAFGSLTEPVVAQFTYLGYDIDYATMRIDGSYSGKSSHSQFRSNFSGVVRPLRNIGVGVAVTLPMTTKSKFSFDKAPTTGGNFDDWEYSYGRDAAYKPMVYQYTFEQGTSFSLLVRIYLETRANVYIEGRGNFTTFKESFNLFRLYASPEYFSNGDISYPAVPAASFQYAVEHQMFVPSLRLGVSPHLGKSGFFNCYVGLDLFAFDGRSFSYTVEHDHDYSTYDQHYYVTLKGKLVGQQSAFVMGMGGGLFF